MPPKNTNDKVRFTPKQMEEHTKTIKMVNGEVSELPDYGKWRVYRNMCHLLGIKPETRGKTPKEDNISTKGLVAKGEAPADKPAENPKVPKLKWHKTEIGKALKLTARIESKHHTDNSERTCDEITAWINVGGAVGAAIKRGELKGVPKEKIISEIDEVDNPDKRLPEGIVTKLGKLFRDDSHVPLEDADREKRNIAAKADKAKKKDLNSKS